MMSLPMPSEDILKPLRQGVVIPASPLALDENRQLDETRQRALFHYYSDAGAGGIAVGVHTTQFEIREPGVGLFEPLLKLAAAKMNTLDRGRETPLVKIAGVCGDTPQAVDEAALAASLGYDAALLSLAALKERSEKALLIHCKTISGIIPLVGFYLQPAVGGRVLPYTFWRRFAEIPNVVAIKVAPFNRYQTLDVVRAVAHAERERDIALYTGNDDNIVLDLLTPYRIKTERGEKILRIRGGLLGQWSVWTKRAVELLEEIHRVVDREQAVPAELWAKAVAWTDANAAIFDAAHHFAGCISGINEVLRRQGLLKTAYCLNPKLRLSPGQAEELDRIGREYPELNDDAFVSEHLPRWLAA